MSDTQATVAEEEYLQIMFWLREAGLPMTGANIARAMQLSPPTVHEMLGRLERGRLHLAAPTTSRVELHRRRAASRPRRSSAATG